MFRQYQTEKDRKHRDSEGTKSIAVSPHDHLVSKQQEELNTAMLYFETMEISNQRAHREARAISVGKLKSLKLPTSDNVNPSSSTVHSPGTSTRPTEGMELTKKPPWDSSKVFDPEASLKKLPGRKAAYPNVQSRLLTPPLASLTRRTLVTQNQTTTINPIVERRNFELLSETGGRTNRRNDSSRLASLLIQQD